MDLEKIIRTIETENARKNEQAQAQILQRVERMRANKVTAEGLMSRIANRINEATEQIRKAGKVATSLPEQVHVTLANGEKITHLGRMTLSLRKNGPSGAFESLTFKAELEPVQIFVEVNPAIGQLMAIKGAAPINEVGFTEGLIDELIQRFVIAVFS